ncbi:MAG: hypothetical protein HC927_11435 [Deltaproteobacteria bacterium]|nr:hypothetical protein [Deltaproteobacteria bacterium]
MLLLTREAIRQALLARAGKVEIEHTRGACDHWRKDYAFTIDGTRRKTLEYIAQHGEPCGADASYDLLSWNYAILYTKDGVRFEPNPLLDLGR